MAHSAERLVSRISWQKLLIGGKVFFCHLVAARCLLPTASRELCSAQFPCIPPTPGLFYPEANPEVREKCDSVFAKEVSCRDQGAITTWADKC